MANRRRKRPAQHPPKLEAPTTDYVSPDGSQTLTLRGAMSAKTRQQFAHETSPAGTRAAANLEDMRARAIEFLFERVVSDWTISEIPTTKPKELITRYRVATKDEREWITGALREHCAAWFPDVKVP